jgi:hypothetical protein
MKPAMKIQLRRIIFYFKLRFIVPLLLLKCQCYDDKI